MEPGTGLVFQKILKINCLRFFASEHGKVYNKSYPEENTAHSCIVYAPETTNF